MVIYCACPLFISPEAQKSTVNWSIIVVFKPKEEESQSPAVL